MGSDINAQTGLTPLMEAASGGNIKEGRRLLDKGANVNARSVPSRDTALTIAADKGHYRFVKLLLSRDAAVDVKNKKGNSPLWLACHGGHCDMVKRLGTDGADIDSQDNRKVSCLMAAFRQGHIEVVKLMVGHVNQFPSDGDLSRYTATITDKELQKKCQQCMEIIRTAIDRQAVKADKNAEDLQDIEDKERQHEENKKAAAAKKREKKKKKKKEKQVKDKEEPSDSKNSTPEPESEDSQPKELDEEKEQPLVLEGNIAQREANRTPEQESESGISVLQNRKQRQATQHSGQAMSKSSSGSPSLSKITSESFIPVGSQTKKEKPALATENDDFGNPPSISERDIERYRKSVDKNKTGHGDKSGSHYIHKSHPEVNPNTLSVKTSPNLVNSPKRVQKKEDGWKEVIRKSKKVPRPASAISRVIGRGGCNINAIREVSEANIVEKNKGSSGERIITIKGSAEATRQAHALKSALVSDPDKELQEILPKSKAKQQPENKSLYFIPPNDTNSSPASNQSSGSQQSKSGNKLAPRLRAAQANAGGSRSTMGGGGVMNSHISVWGGPPTTTSASPQRTKQKHGSAPAPFSSPVPGLNGKMRLSPGTRNQTKPLIPGNVKVQQRPNAGAGLQPQTLPIIANQTTTTATTQTITSASGFNISSTSGEYFPFDNLFSNAAKLLKKDDSMNERMNFAAGVIPTFTGSPGNLGTPSSPGGPVDRGLLAKAPGFKLPVPRMMNPLEMAPGFKGGGFPMSQQMMDMNMFGMNGPGPQGFQNFPQPIQSQSPISSPRSSQSASSGMSPHSSSGFDSSQSLQREEYTTPTQPMTLPKISSSLNPNAPDFMSRTAPLGSNSGTGGPGMGMIPQAMYQQALAQQLLSAFNTMGPAPNPPPGAPSPGPQNQDPLLGMGGQFNKQEFYQNMANLMHQWAIQNQPPGSPGPGMGPSQGPGFPPAPPRAFSPLPAQGRPNSAPSIGGMPKELDMDWNLKGTTPGLTSNMSSVMTTSVLSGAHMTSSLSANGEERVVDLENHDPSRGLDDLSEHNFSPGLQGQGLGQMPLFNGVGPYQLQEGTGFGGSGDGLPSMWNSLDTPDSEDITEKGRQNPEVRGKKRGRPAKGPKERAPPAPQRRKTKAQQQQEAQEEREVAALAALNQKKDQTKEVIASLPAEDLRSILEEVVEKDPTLLFTILERRNSRLAEAPEPQPPSSSGSLPSWCTCTNCREMPTEAEKVCCGKQPQLCISRLARFQMLMLEEEVLDVARLYRQHMLAYPADHDQNRGRRHAAYRQYTPWQHGRLGAGNRLVIPSCCVWRIRDKFPDPFGKYTGFIPGRLG